MRKKETAIYSYLILNNVSIHPEIVVEFEVKLYSSKTICSFIWTIFKNKKVNYGGFLKVNVSGKVTECNLKQNRRSSLTSAAIPIKAYEQTRSAVLEKQ